MGDVHDITTGGIISGLPDMPDSVDNWQPGEPILTMHTTAYVLSPEMDLRAAPCILCDVPLSGSPVALETLVLPYQCSEGHPHLMSITVARHVRCRAGGAEDMADIILAKNHYSFPG